MEWITLWLWTILAISWSSTIWEVHPLSTSSRSLKVIISRDLVFLSNSNLVPREKPWGRGCSNSLPITGHYSSSRAISWTSLESEILSTELAGHIIVRRMERLRAPWIKPRKFCWSATRLVPTRFLLYWVQKHKVREYPNQPSTEAI